MNKYFYITSALLALFLLFAINKSLHAKEKLPELKTVQQVDINKYLGLWYEIARYHAWFEKNCTGVTALYSLKPNGKIEVINSCFKKSLSGKRKTAKGTAWVTDISTNAKLKVRFFWPFAGDYWIIELDNDYKYAVVGCPKRDYLWILCREPRMDEVLYGELLKKIAEKGYDITRIHRTLQPVR